MSNRHVGEYKIENVPDGSYTVTACVRNEVQSKPLALAGNATADFTLTK